MMLLEEMDEKITINRSIFNEKEEMKEKSSNLEEMSMSLSTASAMIAPQAKPSPMPMSSSLAPQSIGGKSIPAAPVKKIVSA